ncbi:hypothetical protein H2203_001858 [Taxawa tesnikishii (nom. ined.)]|nr:hypothetical protein H2203_001858 [Dothideales sp. JES 119]
MASLNPDLTKSRHARRSTSARLNESFATESEATGPKTIEPEIVEPRQGNGEVAAVVKRKTRSISKEPSDEDEQARRPSHVTTKKSTAPGTKAPARPGTFTADHFSRVRRALTGKSTKQRTDLIATASKSVSGTKRTSSADRETSEGSAEGSIRDTNSEGAEPASTTRTRPKRKTRTTELRAEESHVDESTTDATAEEVVPTKTSKRIKTNEGAVDGVTTATDAEAVTKTSKASKRRGKGKAKATDAGTASTDAPASGEDVGVATTGLRDGIGAAARSTVKGKKGKEGRGKEPRAVPLTPKRKGPRTEKPYDPFDYPMDLETVGEDPEMRGKLTYLMERYAEENNYDPADIEEGETEHAAAAIGKVAILPDKKRRAPNFDWDEWEAEEPSANR